MKIYDCSIFRNELDLLEIRLKELYDHVDHFVIAEATHTFQGEPKELVLKNNWDRFSKWHEKMIYVVVDDMPNDKNAWANEHHQRNSILLGIEDAADDDIIIIGDSDEILRSTVIDDMRQNSRDIYGFRTPYFNFKFNYMLVDDPESYCVWIVAGKKKIINLPENLRSTRFQLNSLGYEHDDGRIKIYEHAGWHFTYLGDNEWITTKLKSFSHTELNKPEVLNKINVEEMITKGVGFNPLDPRPFVKVLLDDYFPKSIVENRIKYTSLIINDATDPITDYF